MKRKLYDQLLKWKTEEHGESAVLIEGARRVGKSWIAEEFAKREYDAYLIIDFSIADAEIKSIFNDYLGNDVDVATGCAYLRGRGRDEAYVYDARQDRVTAEIDFSSSAWPQDPKGFVFAGVENGVGMVFTGMRNWVRVGWDGKIVDSGSLSRKGIVSVRHTLGHGRLAISLKGYAPAVLSLRDGSIIKGCSCLPSAEGRFLVHREKQ